MKRSVVLFSALFCFFAASGRAAVSIDEAWATLDRGDARKAFKLFKKVDKAEGGESAQAKCGAAWALLDDGAYEKAVDWAEDASALSAEPVWRGLAHHLAGVALVRQGDAKDHPAELLRRAESQFLAALKYPEDRQRPDTIFSLALTQLRLGKTEEGQTTFTRFLDDYPNHPMKRQAETYRDDPRRARGAWVPVFEIETLDGQSLSDRSIEGQVVLIDFWAMWCPPCVAAVPSLRRLADSFAGDPRFELVSVSVDDDEKSLRKFVAENEMNWAQVWDNRRALTGRPAFDVTVFPTHVLLGPDGEILHRDSGWSAKTHADLVRRIRSAVSGLPDG